MTLSANERQRAFVSHYLTLWNGQEAARLAGYAHPKQAAARLLTEPYVKGEIEARLSELKIGADEVLVRIAEHARGSMGSFIAFDAEGAAYLDLLRAADQLHLIKRFTQDRHGKITIELYDAQAALALLARHHGLFLDRTEHTFDISGVAEGLDRKLNPDMADSEPESLASEPNTG